MRRISSVLTVIGTTVALAVSGGVAAVAAEAPAGKTLSVGTTAAKVGVPHGAVDNSYADRYQATYEKTDMDPVRIDIRPAGSTKVVLSVTKFRFVDEGDSQFWVSDPIVLDAVGYYEVDIHAKNPKTGAVGSRAKDDTFRYVPGAKVELASSKQEFSLDSLDAVATGRVTAKDPKTGGRVPVPGTQVEVFTDDESTGTRASGKTDADGRFSIPFSATGTEEELVLAAEFTEDEGRHQGRLPLKIKAQQALVAMNGPTTNLTVRYGEVPLTGKFTRLSDDGTVKPVGAGHPVYAKCIAPESCRDWTYAPGTGDDGSFGITPKVTQPGTWNVSADSPWLSPSTGGSFTIAKVTGTTRMTEEKVTASTAEGKLTFSGKAHFVDGATKKSTFINVESLGEDGKWSIRKTTLVPFNQAFTVTADVPVSKVTAWRLSVAEMRTTGPSTGTRILKPKRLVTWISPGKIPYTLTKGSPLTLKGTLYTLAPDGTFKPLAGKKVRYFFKAQGSSTWKEMSTSTTSETGYYRRTVIPTQTGDWQVRFADGGSTHFNNTTYETTVHLL